MFIPPYTAVYGVHVCGVPDLTCHIVNRTAISPHNCQPSAPSFEIWPTSAATRGCDGPKARNVGRTQAQTRHTLTAHTLPPQGPTLTSCKVHHTCAASHQASMASRVTVKQMRAELKLRGLPIHGTKDVLVQRCQLNGVSCAGPGSARMAESASTSPGLSDAVRPTPAPVPAMPDESHPSSPRHFPHGAPDADAPFASTAGRVTDKNLGAAAPQANSVRTPPFTKHERARLGHVLCHGEVAAGVIVSRGPLSRQQVDSRSSRLEVWSVVVAKLFNGPEVFMVPAICAGTDIDATHHPLVRSGQCVRAKWTKV